MLTSFRIFVASMLVALVVAGPAAAQVTQKAYSLRAGVTETQIQPKAQSQSGSLPFTGLQLSVVLGVGVVLLGAGLMIRRVSRPDQA